MIKVQGHQTHAEYQTDGIFHGTRSLLGEDVVDEKRMWWMYKKDADDYPNDIKALWGKGFSLYGLLPDDSKVDRTDLESKIKNKYFDLIIVTVHCTVADIEKAGIVYSHLSRFAHYDKSQIAFIDGLDNSNMIYHVPNATYFKRELKFNRDIYPISFSIPKEKIVQNTPKKSQDFATVIPWWKRTYIFDREKDYYEDYQKSYFGYNCKKGGWDTMRGLEILANGCLPYFIDIDDCPQNTLFRYPKNMCKNVLSWKSIQSRTDILSANFERGKLLESFDHQKYDDVRNEMVEYTKENLTTESMAKYLLGIMHNVRTK